MKESRARPQEREETEGGFAYVAVLGIIMALGAFLIVGVRAGMQRTFTARQLAYRVRAESIAEGGAGKAYAMLAENFDLVTNEAAFAVTDYAGGTYDVTVTPVGEDTAVIESVGTFQSMSATVVLDVRRHVTALDPDPANPFGYAILADGEISWTGCGTFAEDSLVHANELFKQAGSGALDAFVSSSVEVTLKGNSGEIDGDVTAPRVSGKTSKVTGTITEGPVDAVPIPSIDLVPYYNEALANGEVYDGDQSLSSAFAPPGGVMWVNGDLHVSGPGDLTGSFIATGDIHLSGSGGHNKVLGYPAFVSRDGGIKISGSGTYEGLVYARIGDIEITGSGALNGSIICGGDFKKAGVSTIFTYVESMPVAPNEVQTDGVLCVQAWQK